MTPHPTDWHGVALTKLTRVLGPIEGPALASSTLGELGLQRVGTAQDLRALGIALERRGGFEAAVGGLLLVHATLYG